MTKELYLAIKSDGESGILQSYTEHQDKAILYLMDGWKIFRVHDNLSEVTFKDLRLREK